MNRNKNIPIMKFRSTEEGKVFILNDKIQNTEIFPPVQRGKTMREVNPEDTFHFTSRSSSAQEKSTPKHNRAIKASNLTIALLKPYFN